ncbi:hypothetical protein BOTCAL_0040g00090 [Botryotinia calthae]|uniref:Uncharacterized protein n=1 Tax=Botryotinia calthae TaxID=38488 RepID=A0A4Y8DEG9_9HELO|nr:hypothetical protein BOTCAL_0040g00090 [Botryotinia calthae]
MTYCKMTRQPSDQSLDAPHQPANPFPIPTTQSVPQSSLPHQKPAVQQTSSSDHVYQSTNAVSCSVGQGQEDVFVPPPRLTYLDLLIIENSGFPSMAEFEIFLQLYQKSYYHMELAERKKLFQQVELLRQSMRHPQSIQALVEAQQSIQAGQPFLSLKHYANFSRNGYMLTSMISRCLNLTSFALQRAVFNAAAEVTRNSDKSNIATISGKTCEDILSRGVQHCTAEDILRLETIVYIRPSEHHVNNPPSKVTTRTDLSPFSYKPLPYCPDPPMYRSMKTESNASALSLQQPWTYSQCLDYLAGRTIDFMNSRNPEAFFFSLPSDDKLQGMTADQRAEFVRKHIIEQDAKRALPKSGNCLCPVDSKTSERLVQGRQSSLLPELDTTASTSKGNPYIQGTLENHRTNTTHDIFSSGGRHGFQSPSISSADCRSGMGYEHQQTSSIAADDGCCDSDLGDDDDSDWAPNQSENLSPPSRSTKRVSFATSATDIPGNLREQENTIIPSDFLSFTESESGDDQANTKDNESLSESIRDCQDLLWTASVTHAASAVDFSLASGDEDNILVPVSPPRTSVSKRRNRKHPSTRPRVAQPGAQRRGGDFNALLDTLEKHQLQLASLPKLNNENIDLWNENPQKLTKKSQGLKSQEVFFPAWEEVPVQQGNSDVGHATQEDSMLAMQEMLLGQQKKKRIQLLRGQAALQAMLISKTGPKNDHGLEASAHEPALLTLEQESKNQVESKRQEQLTMPAASLSLEKASQTKPVESRASLGNGQTVFNGPPNSDSLMLKEAQQFELCQLGKLKNRSALLAPRVGKPSASARAPKDFKQDRAAKFDDLKKFADEFKMSTPVPSDIAFINHGPLLIAIKEENLLRGKGAAIDESKARRISVEEATRLLAAQKLAKEISTATNSATVSNKAVQ